MCSKYDGTIMVYIVDMLDHAQTYFFAQLLDRVPVTTPVAFSFSNC